MRKSKKIVAKKKTTRKNIECVYTDETRRIMKIIKSLKKNTTKKHTNA